jgi:hypothetical protein
VVASLALGVHLRVGDDDLEGEFPWNRAVPGDGGADSVTPDSVTVEVVYLDEESLVASRGL